jgi:archaellum component FlaC|tara:strand:+ start:2761 stop:3012 length:252 start_codon:yes stop_codon:yes gene_type:complete
MEEMEITWIIWNVIVTLVVAPLVWSIRQNMEELKRQGVLLNRTREEMAKHYVTKDELESNMERIMRILNKLESKLDKLFDVKQ